jgi:two-component system response regulator RegA
MRTRVLVVDDDPLIRAVSRRILERAGAEVSVAGSVAEALAQLGAGRLEVAILDYFLGADCGCDLIAPLRARYPALRIVVLSGLGGLPELIRHAHQAGADQVASKIQVDWLALVRGDAAAASTRPRPAVDLVALKREAIHGTFLVHNRNVSTTARALGINRSSLQRVLRKTPPPGLGPIDQGEEE